MESGQVRARSLAKMWMGAGIIALAAAVYLAVPAVSNHVNRAVTLLSMGDVPALKAYVLSFGVWAPVASGLLMVLQAIIAPLPAFLITMANGMLFGAWWGGLLSWTSALASALLCFLIADALGRPVVERLVGRRGLRLADNFFQNYGTFAVLVARLIPIVPFDPISYGAGLTRMPVRRFALATGIGIIPATMVYSWLGENLGAADLWLWGAVALSVLLAGSLMFRLFVRKRLSEGRRAAG
ncbi:MAG: TVP38/TMEM64 family protein [Nitrospinota bacterium]